MGALDDGLRQQAHADRIEAEREMMRETGLSRREVREQKAGGLSAEEQIVNLEAAVAHLQKEVQRLREKEKQWVGKDGIKVEPPFIILDPAAIPAGAVNQEQGFPFAVNVIEAGVLRVRRFYITEQVDDPDPEEED